MKEIDVLNAVATSVLTSTLDQFNEDVELLKKNLNEEENTGINAGVAFAKNTIRGEISPHFIFESYGITRSNLLSPVKSAHDKMKKIGFFIFTCREFIRQETKSDLAAK